MQTSIGTVILSGQSHSSSNQQSLGKGRKASLLILCTIMWGGNVDTGKDPCFVDIKTTAVKF